MNLIRKIALLIITIFFFLCWISLTAIFIKFFIKEIDILIKVLFFFIYLLIIYTLYKFNFCIHIKLGTKEIRYRVKKDYLKFKNFLKGKYFKDKDNTKIVNKYRSFIPIYTPSNNMLKAFNIPLAIIMFYSVYLISSFHSGKVFIGFMLFILSLRLIILISTKKKRPYFILTNEYICLDKRIEKTKIYYSDINDISLKVVQMRTGTIYYLVFNIKNIEKYDMEFWKNRIILFGLSRKEINTNNIFLNVTSININENKIVELINSKIENSEFDIIKKMDKK